MRSSTRWLTVLVCAVMAATVISAALLLSGLIRKETGLLDGEEQHEILIADYLEVYSDRCLQLTPELYHADGRVVGGKYVYACESEAVAVSKEGNVSVLDPTYEGEIEILITERITGTEKRVTLRIVSELAYVREVRTAEGSKITDGLGFLIGDSYTFEVVTVPAAVSLADYFDFYVTDADGARVECMDYTLRGNNVTLTVKGIGRGNAHFVMKNEGRDVSFEQTVAFEARLPDAALTEAALAAAGEDLLDPAALASVSRVVLPASAEAVDFSRVPLYMQGLKTAVLEAEGVISATALPSDLVLRVKGLDLYLAYVSDPAWSDAASRIYPYEEAGHTHPVAVYHNERPLTVAAGSASLLSPVGGGYGIKELDTYTVDFLSQSSPKHASATLISGYELPTYAFTGYRFVGWQDAEGNAVEDADLAAVAEGIHLYAVWEAERYTVTLEDYCSGDATAILTYNGGSSIAYQPQKAGWQFVGWYLSEEYAEEERVSADTLYGVAGNSVTLYAKYTATVALDMRGLSENGSVVGAVYGKPLGDGLPLLAATGGWEPHGFYADEGYTAEGYIDPAAPFVLEEAGITLHAKYTYALNFNALYEISGVGIFASNVSVGSVNIYCGLTLGEALAIEDVDMPYAWLTNNGDWYFDGWTSSIYNFTLMGEAGFLTDALPESSMITADSRLTPATATAYAVYRSDISVKTGLTAENTLTTLTLTFGCRFGTPAIEAPAIRGYSFDGWYSSDLKLTESTCMTLSFGSLDLVAKYNADRYLINVQHPSEDGSLVPFWDTAENDSDCVLNNNTGSGLTGRGVLLPHLPDRAGHTKAWAISEAGGLSAPIRATLTEDGYLWDVPADIFEDILLYPVYAPITYLVSFDTHGAPDVDELVPLSVVYGTELLLPPPKSPEGYSFAGWYLSPEYAESERLDSGDVYLIASNSVLYAKYEKKVSFIGYYNTVEHTLIYGMDYTGENAVFTAPPEYDPETSCWRFVGWEDALGGMTQGDFHNYRRTEEEYTAVFMRDITLVVGEGFALPAGEEIITVRRGIPFAEQGITLPTDADLAKTGSAVYWTLTDWYFYHPTMSPARISMRVSDPVDILGGMVDTIYAEYTATVTVNIPYPSGVPTDSFEIDLVLGLPFFEQLDEACAAHFAAEYDRGYYQIGWRSGEELFERDLENGYGGSVAMLTHAGVAVEAAFKPNPYTVIYDAAGGTGVPSVDLAFGTDITLADAPIYTGYVFLGWDDGEGNLYEAGAVLRDLVTSGSITLTAKWRPAAYTVVPDAAGGDALESISAVYDTPFTLPTPVRAHYRFLGWQLGTDSILAAGEVSNLTDEDGATLTLTALWEPYPYNVFFCTESGEVVFARGYTVENRNIILPTEPPAKLGYTVVWEDYSERLATLAEDFCVYPVYTPIQYTLNFDLGLGGESYYQQILTYDRSEMLGAPDPSRAHYHFSGWRIGDAVYFRLDDLINLASEPSTVTATAVWTPVEYSVFFYDRNGAVVDEQIYTVEDYEITPPAVPAIARYDGVWESYTLTAGQVDVHPIYTPTVYTVTFYASGTAVGSDTYTVENMTVTPPAVPAKTGYKDEVWESYDLSALTNLTVNARYTPISYSVRFVNYDGTAVYETLYLLYGETAYISNEKPHQSGYTFLCWKCEETGTEYSAGAQLTNLTAEDGATLTFREQRRLSQFRVTFNAMGGTLPSGASDRNVTVAEYVFMPAAATYKGYTFGGWKNSITGKILQPGDNYWPSDYADGTVITFTAIWERTPYNLVFDANGGTGGGTLTVYYNHQVDANGVGVPGPGTNGDKTFDGWFTAKDGGDKVSIDDNTIVDWTGDRTLYAHWSGCVASGTEVTLADGSTKKVEDLTGDELLLTWDFVNGCYTASPIVFLYDHGVAEYAVINLCFSDGSVVRAIASHGFYDRDLQSFVYINAENCTAYIGHSFAKMNGKDAAEEYEFVTLTDAYVTHEVTGSYSVWTAGSVNFITNGVLSLTPLEFSFCEKCFAYGEDLRFDQEAMQADIEKYGLYTYEEWSDYLTYEQFLAFNGPYMKVAVGKGMTTKAELLALIAQYVNPEQ